MGACLAVPTAARAGSGPSDKANGVKPPATAPIPAPPPDAVDSVTASASAPDGGAARPPGEEKRVGFLCGLGVLDTPPDPRFDDITSLLCTIFNVPIAIVSLVDAERQWFKSICGLGATETDRRSSFCAWTLLPAHPEVLVVPDACQDARFAANPLVTGEPGIRFYAGAPLVASSGDRLGSLCVIDTVPRTIDADQCNVLVNFAEVVVRELEKEKRRLVEAAALRSRAARALRAVDGLRDCVLLVDAAAAQAAAGGGSGGGSTKHTKPAGAWPVLFANGACAAGAGVDPAADAGRDLWALFSLAAPASPADLVPRVAAGAPFHAALVRRDGGGRYAAVFRPAATAHLDGAPAIGIPASGATGSGRGGATDGLYFVTLAFKGWSVPRPRPPPRRALSEALPPLTPDAAADLRASLLGPSSADGAPSPPAPAADGDGAAGPATDAAADAATPADPLADVELGLLIGAGAYGRVYRGMWGGLPVAVKVVPHADIDSGGGPDSGDGTTAPAAAASLRGALELMHSVNLDHPGIVKTYKSAQRTLAAGAAPSPTASTTAGAPALRQPPRILAETWLIMEYCDGGNLQDAVDRGVFWERPPRGAEPTRVGLPVPASAPRPSPASAAGSLVGGSFCVGSPTPDGSVHGWPSLPPGAGADPVSASGTPLALAPDMRAIAATAADVAAAMAYLHSLDVLHGDLTGGNVLLCSTPAAVEPSASPDPSPRAGAAAASTRPAPRPFTAKVADFGLARVLAADAVSTGTYGTVTHMPPELLTSGRLSKAADVYAFGVLLWEMYTGRRPWAGLMQMQVIFAVTVRRARLEFPAPCAHPKYAALAEDCMARAPEDRPSFEQVLDRLKSVEGAEG